MLSSCSNGGLSHEMSVFSMWRDATQMLSVATAHRRRVTRMRQRMATWLQAGSSAQQTDLQYLRLARNGLELSWLSLEKSFLLLSRNWTLGHFAVHSDLFELTPTGNTDPLWIRTAVPTVYLSARTKFQSLTTGYNEIWRDLSLVSSPRPCGAGYILGLGCLGGALPVARGDVGAPFGFPRHRTSPPCQVCDMLSNH